MLVQAPDRYHLREVFVSVCYGEEHYQSRIASTGLVSGSEISPQRHRRMDQTDKEG